MRVFLRYMCLLLYRSYCGIAFIASKLASRIRINAIITQRGNGCYFHWSAFIKNPQNVSVGSSVKIARRCVVGAKSRITIGNNVVLSYGVMLETAGLVFSGDRMTYVSQPITIEDDVWVGANAIVLGDVTIGKGSIIGAGAIVTKNVLPYSVVVGHNKVVHPKNHAQRHDCQN